MAQTSLLPPVSAVCMIWARTGLFSNDEYSGQNAKMVEAELNTIRDCAEGDENEKKYMRLQGLLWMQACVIWR